MNRSHSAKGITAAVLFGVVTQSHAVSWQAGDWTLGLGGNVNAFYTHTQCDDGDLSSGGTTLAGLACPTDGNKQSVSNGLLPASLNFSAETNQNGFDISSHINVYYGIASQGGTGSDALAFSTVDARQVYLTFGNENLGTFKFGRDFGLFAFDAIINDMSLLGAGSAFTSADPGHTTLGGLGFGYVYTDRLAQMNYTTPKMGGFQGTIGIFNPMDGLVEGGSQALGESSVGYHMKGSYSWDGSMPGMVSATFISQDVDVGTESSQIRGYDLFAKIGIGDFGLAGYFFDGQGMSSLALGGLVFPGFAADGTEEESSGYYLQGTYSFGNTKVGLHWSESEQEEVTEVENERMTLGVYHNLTPSLTLLGEYNQQKSTLDAGDDETSSINVGAILFF